MFFYDGNHTKDIKNEFKTTKQVAKKDPARALNNFVNWANNNPYCDVTGALINAINGTAPDRSFRFNNRTFDFVQSNYNKNNVIFNHVYNKTKKTNRPLKLKDVQEIVNYVAEHFKKSAELQPN